MNTLRVGIAAIIFTCAWALIIGVVTPRSLSNPLVGVWRFESEIDTKADGTVVATATARDKHGFIVYTPDDFVSAIIMPSKRSWLLDSATRKELAASADDGTSYAGRYEIDTRTQTVTHILAVSFEPAYEGRRLERKYALSGNSLSLSGTYSSKGETFNFALHLVRSSPTKAVQKIRHRDLIPVAGYFER